MTSKERAALAAAAQTLSPVVFLGRGGESGGVVAALDRALGDHELVKLRFVDHKGERHDLADDLAAKTDSVLIRVIGNVAVFYRRHPDPEKRKYG